MRSKYSEMSPITMRMFNGLVLGINLFVLLSALNAQEMAHLNVNRVTGARLIPKESDIRRKTILETILHGWMIE